MPSPHREIHDWHSDPQKTSRKTETCKNASTTNSAFTNSDSFVFMKRRRILKNQFPNSKSRFRVLGRGNAWVGWCSTQTAKERMKVVFHNSHWFLLYYLSLVLWYCWHLSLHANRFKQASIEWWRDLELGRKWMRSLYVSVNLLIKLFPYTC